MDEKESNSETILYKLAKNIVKAKKDLNPELQEAFKNSLVSYTISIDKFFDLKDKINTQTSQTLLKFSARNLNNTLRTMNAIEQSTGRILEEEGFNKGYVKEMRENYCKTQGYDHELLESSLKAEAARKSIGGNLGRA